MDFLTIDSSSVHSVSIEFKEYISAAQKEKKAIYDKLQPVIGRYATPHKGMSTLDIWEFESFGKIYLRNDDVTSKYISALKKTGVKATLRYGETRKYFPYSVEVRKTKKRVPKVYSKLNCSITHTDIEAENTIIEFIYPKNILRLKKKIFILQDKKEDPFEEDLEIEGLKKKVREGEKSLSAIYKKLVEKYSLDYEHNLNALEYNQNFSLLFCHDKFSKQLYYEAGKLLPPGYGMRVVQMIFYDCDI